MVEGGCHGRLLVKGGPRQREGDPGSMLVMEEQYIAEVIEPGGTEPVRPGTVGELVLTNLGRVGSPLIRYRTGDLVAADPDPKRLRTEIKKTVVHELAHHFGWTDRDLERFDANPDPFGDAGTSDD